MHEGARSCGQSQDMLMFSAWVPRADKCPLISLSCGAQLAVHQRSKRMMLYRFSVLV